MFIDASLVFSDAQTVTVTAVSTNTVDTLAAGDAYVGAWFVARVATAFTASGSATMQIDLLTSATSTFTSTTTLISSGAIGKATLVAGYTFKARIGLGALRYLEVNYTVASGPMTAGAIDAFIVKDVDQLIA